MLLARQERTLAIDGVYIHVRPNYLLFAKLVVQLIELDHAIIK